ncbi:carbonyl reductase [NADPH] 1-like [Bradysia coprophila]|uniref:carbonyl reductase [NADPH] 1-like n=1 Tax=Bradysia coprophila TaxID=38358 RepID=UPI00187DC87B|nr:carbonyl reductase [NADPH] 1-like [Bradysia coprophila]
MTSKVYVVTGSNKGIGFAIVRALCKQNDGIVYLTARDEGRGLNSVEALKKEGLNPNFHQLDIESVDSIITFRDYLKSTHGGIDVLVNNAAIAFKNNATEPFSEQAEVSCRVNFFATMKFCDELLPLLRPHGRVVNVSSSAGYLKRINGKAPESLELQKKFADPKLTRDTLVSLVNDFVQSSKTNIHTSKGWPNSAYSVSKVAVSALSRIQQREMDETRPDDDILVNHVHPGYVDTDMTSHKGHLTIDQGADAPSWLALLAPNTPSNPKGAYVWYDRRIVDWVDGLDPGAY